MELKRSTSELKEGVISAAAMLNKHARGELFFGIRNDGTVLGQSVSEQTLRDVSRALSEGIKPRVYPQVERVRLAGGDCVRVRLAGSDAPYLAFGRAYIRVGDEDRQLSARELERMFLRRGGEEARWESRLSPRKLSDVDAASLRRLVKRASAAGRLDLGTGSVRGTLNKLGLMRGGRLLNAAEVLFCHDNSLELQAAVFAGTDKGTFLDIKQFKGTLLSLLQKAETYVREHIDWEVKIGGLQREEIPEVPADALREALVNSFCHRDFAIPKGNEVAIFKDRVEIFRPGDFPEGYRPLDFIQGEERSILRNPLIAGVLFKSKDIEKWGSGLKRISKACASGGVQVDFQVLKSGFLVTFHRRLAGGLTHGTVVKTVGETVVKTVVKTVGKSRHKVETRIVSLIKARPEITVVELARRTGLSPRGVEWNIRRLKSQMGTPVKIYEMAKNLLLLSGLEPGRDIEIKLTGLKPGEKMDEELVENASDVQDSQHPSIMVLKAEASRGIDEKLVMDLEILTRTAPQQSLVRKLKDLVPTFSPDAAHGVGA